MNRLILEDVAYALGRIGTLTSRERSGRPNTRPLLLADPHTEEFREIEEQFPVAILKLLTGSFLASMDATWRNTIITMVLDCVYKVSF